MKYFVEGAQLDLCSSGGKWSVRILVGLLVLWYLLKTNLAPLHWKDWTLAMSFCMWGSHMNNTKHSQGQVRLMCWEFCFCIICFLVSSKEAKFLVGFTVYFANMVPPTLGLFLIVTTTCRYAARSVFSRVVPPYGHWISSTSKLLSGLCSPITPRGLSKFL